MILRIAQKQRIVKREELFTAYYPYIPDFDVRHVRLDSDGLSATKMNIDYLVTREEGDRQIPALLNYLRQE